MKSKYSRRHFLGEAATSLLSETDDTFKLKYVDYSNKILPRHLQKTGSGLNAYNGNFGEEEIKHLLGRVLPGYSKNDIDFFKTLSLSNAVNYILTIPQLPPPPPLNNYGNTPNLSDPNVPVGETWVNAPYNGTVDFARKVSFKAWWMSLFVNNDRSIREKMTLFWHNHFATESNAITDARYIYKNNALLRQYCLGNFKTLVKQITIDPAMLDYLNGNQNTKTAPDENYARELQELFTVGKDLPVHYTEEDVRQAARVLTGWRDNRTGLNALFDSSKHDTGNKTFSSFYNNAVIIGKTGTAGANELDELLDIIFAHPEVAKYLCRKIYRFFVYYLIDEQVENNVIVPMANILRTNNYEIKPVLEALFKSEHFYDVLNRGCIIKSPVDFVSSLFKQFNLQLPALSNVELHYAHALFTIQTTALIGQNIGDPPSVAGWPAYYENPQYYELWINSDSLPKRNQLADMMIYTGYNRNGYKMQFDLLAFASQFSNVANPNVFIADVTKLLYAIEISQNHKNTIKTSFLLSGQSEDYYWSDVWNAYLANPLDTAKKNAVLSRIQAMFKYILGLAEYQLC